MRVLPCKLQCPFMCFCKPSSHIFSFKLDHHHHHEDDNNNNNLNININISNPHPVEVEVGVEVDDENDDHVGGLQVQENVLDDKQEEGTESCCRKSSLRTNSKEEQKKKVQWMDYMGKELVQVREFEPSQVEKHDNETEDGRGCVCVIL